MSIFKKNLCLTTDSYKLSHPSQFPAGSRFAHYYIEARSENEETIVGGFNLIAKILSKKVKMKHVERANKLSLKHFGREVFNYEGWKRIATDFGGNLPLALYGVKEGTLFPTKNVMGVLFNTHEDFVWLPGHFETLVLRSVWYQTTVATKSFMCKKVINKYLGITSDLTGSDYDFVRDTRLHDFGARGATSSESASTGGLAHLYNFIGTDTLEALILAQDLYDEECAGISIPAREHSTTICYTNEDDAYKNSISLYGEGVYACVMDSTDYKKSVERVCIEMKDKIVDAGGTFVFRPDSGDMIDNIMYTLEVLGKHFGYTYNEKGYKVLSEHCRIIQGDDINDASDIERVLSWMESRRWAAENIAFGMGGGLLQKVNRDTHKFAMKLSLIDVGGQDREVCKNPKGAEWKKSKSGLVGSFFDTMTGEVVTLNIKDYEKDGGVPSRYQEMMIAYYQNGRVVHKDTLKEIRDRINEQL